MTGPVTDADIRPDDDAPDGPAGGGERNRQAGQWLRGLLQRWRAVAGGWWAWTAQPLSLREAWRLSAAVDPDRLPPRAPWWLGDLWRLSNWTDRLAWFVLMLLAPSGLQGPLRWLAVRPTRRLGTYVVVAALTVGFVATGKGH